VIALFTSALMLGIFTSVHCISMCGPMVVTYAVKSEDGDGWQQKVLPNLAYQGAKLASYVLVGLLLGAIGSAFNLDGIRPYVMLVAGLFMLVLGLGMTGKVPWAARLTPRPPRALINALSRLRRKATADADAGASTLATPIAFGLLTGLMPCAPLQAAELTAASSGGVLQGALVMLAFGLGTMPLLFAFGTASSLIPVRWKHRLTFVLAFVVMGLGLVFLNRSAMLLGLPINANSIKTAVIGGPAPATPASYKTASDGTVEVNLTVANGQYSPSALSIPADKPVRLIVSRPEDNACSSQLSFPQLGVLKNLAANGTTVVNLPATKAGSYTMTCGMGMLSGQLLVGPTAAGGGGAPSGESPAVWLVFTVLAGAGALYTARGLKPAEAPARAASHGASSGAHERARSASASRRKPVTNRSRG
jgi:sulfite exporter TauE/SafE